MKLTGKCKEAFLKDLDVEEQWFNDEYTELFQNTLIIEFFDSVGIYINAIKYGNHWLAICNHSGLDVYLSRQEATNAAIEKANEIYNEN